MRQQLKPNHRQQSHGQYIRPAIQQLSQNMLDIPLKKTKHINQMLQLQAKQKKILQQMDPKPIGKSLSQDSLVNNKSLFTSAQGKPQPSSGGCNSSYIVGCIMRSFGFRKLSVEDIADIFRVKADLVEDIDKLRILSQFEGGSQRSNHKLEAMKSDILVKLGAGLVEEKESNGLMDKKGFKELMSQFPKYRKKRTTLSSSTNQFATQHIQQQPTTLTRPHPTYQHTTQPYEPLPEHQYDTYQYQRLLRHKPPRLDEKVVALVQIQKKFPELTQKDILRKLDEDYGIKDMNQASISRYIKRIYQMKEKVEVLLRAEREGWVVL